MGMGLLTTQLVVRNFLSFGPESEPIGLGPLNVVIGPNNSGKSNLVEAVHILTQLPGDLRKALAVGDGVEAWLWRGERAGREVRLGLNLTFAECSGDRWSPAWRGDSRGEAAWQCWAKLGLSIDGPRFRDEEYIATEDGKRVVTRRSELLTVAEISLRSGRGATLPNPADLNPFTEDAPVPQPPPDRSVLAVQEIRYRHRHLSLLADYLRAIRLYRTWTMGREAPARRAQDASGQADYLEPDGANLALLLRDFELHSGLANRITTELRRLSPTVDRYSVVGIHGQLMLYLQEAGLSKAVSALRLSDGMLRYLCLLAILLHPTPPPLVVLEEPELGLHPDLHGRIGELLVEASEQMQLIVTTHSPGVLAALRPEHVMVCERADHGTQVKRLTAEALREWLDQYTLGDLWQMGVIGGNRY
ncbi:MAG: AAA family ATPase [Fimbriimonadaceae bacterium]|nr:AAA family ATPase [Fimbriimonadaceae bacterium]